MDPTKGNDPPNGSQGTPPPEDGSEKEAPKYVTPEQLNSEINRAISGRFKEFEKKRDKADEGLVSKFDELISAKFDAFKPLLAPPPPAEKPKDEGKKDGAPPPPPPIEEHPQFKEMQKRVEDLQKRSAQDEQKRKQQFDKSRDVELRSTTQSLLTNFGIAPQLAKRAMGELIDVNKRLRFENDEFGAPAMWRNDDGDLVPAEEGIRSWIESEEAKLYLPAKPIEGSGSSPNSGGAPRGKPNKDGRIPLSEYLARRQSGG